MENNAYTDMELLNKKCEELSEKLKVKVSYEEIPDNGEWIHLGLKQYNEGLGLYVGVNGIAGAFEYLDGLEMGYDIAVGQNNEN